MVQKKSNVLDKPVSHQKSSTTAAPVGVGNSSIKTEVVKIEKNDLQIQRTENYFTRLSISWTWSRRRYGNVLFEKSLSNCYANIESH